MKLQCFFGWVYTVEPLLLQSKFSSILKVNNFDRITRSFSFQQVNRLKAIDKKRMLIKITNCLALATNSRVGDSLTCFFQKAVMVPIAKILPLDLFVYFTSSFQFNYPCQIS